MRRSLVSLIFTAALLLEYNALSVALPVGQIEDGSMEQDAFTSLLSDEAAENSLADADLTSVSKGRASREIVVAVDPSLWRDLRVLQNGLSVYKRRAEDHRDAGQQPNIPILRRDTMRCMVGRVYRPCWEV
ncbi:pro-melanin-concentrating hormone, like [Austrofundulus limnaeus]|uniref:Pro-melanin-concentrating hormone, like n=1 Tax=Austrofundulus limnaeus TaxID=52670 RepID=A0A2I4CDH8_AUSLI|nr:PREDICTED: pro-MCH-like [Austrofundulus limnaeus]